MKKGIYKLTKLNERLEDLLEERDFVLSPSVVHLSAGIVKKYEWEIHNLEEKIIALEEFNSKII